MTKKLSNKSFNLKVFLETLIMLFIPVMTFFSILSDRSPYNKINIAVYGVMSLLIIFYVAKYHSFKFDVFPLLIVLFNVIILVSQIVNGRISEYPRTMLLLSAFSLIIYQFFIHYEKKNNIFLMILIGGVLFGLFFIVKYFPQLKHLDFSQRLGEEFSDQNDLAKYLSIFGLISLIYFIKSKWLLKIPFGIALLLFVFLILVGGSISNLLTFVIVAFVTVMVTVKRQNRFIVLFVALGFVALFFVFLQLPIGSYFRERIPKIINTFINGDAKGDNSAIERFELFEYALRLFISKPIFGYGYDQVQYYTIRDGIFSHNNFVELGASFGIFGLIVYEALLIWPVYKMFKDKKFDSNTFSTILYLFLFQIFLIIYRKKIEFVLIPLTFSMYCFGYYPYFEIKFVKNTIVFNIQKPIINQKEVERDNNHRMLNVLTISALSDDFANHLTEISQVLTHYCTFNSIYLVNSKKDADNKTKFYISKSMNGLRRLSFFLDDNDADVVYVNSEVFTKSLYKCLSSKKKIVCVITNESNKNYYVNKKVKYVTMTSITQFAKKKAELIDLSIVPDSKKEKNYDLSFIANNRSEKRYQTVVDLFKGLHNINPNYRFAIYALDNVYNEIRDFFKENKIDFIDLLKEDSDNLLVNSKSNIVFDDSRLDIAYSKLSISVDSITIQLSNNELDNQLEDSNRFIKYENDEELVEAVNKIISNKRSINVITKQNKEKEYDVKECHLAYQYMKLFTF